MAIVEEKQHVILADWGEIKGVGAALLIALAEPFRRAAADELRRNDILLRKQVFSFISSIVRMKKHCDAVSREFGENITKLAKRKGEAPPSIEAVIENLQRHGYRLNPNTVRIIARSQLREEKDVTLSGRRVTHRKSGSVKSAP